MNNTQELHEIIVSALAMLSDQEKGYPYRELHIDLPQLISKAKAAGVDLSDLGEDE